MSTDGRTGRAPGIRIATIGGVPVYIGSSWLVLALIIVALTGPDLASARPDLGALAYAVAVAYAVLLLVAVLVHEGAHAVLARRFGYPVHRVVADLWGGHTALDVTKARPGPSALVAVAGPAANGLLAVVGVAAAAVAPAGVPSGLAHAFAWLNGLLALFNLLPGLPLDGGQLVESGVWAATGSRGRGRMVAGYCGIAVTGLVVGYAVVLPLLRGRTPTLFALGWSLLIAWFLWQGARSAIVLGRGSSRIEGLRILDALIPAAPLRAETLLAEVPNGIAPLVVDAAGTPVALVDATAVAAVPPQAYPHTTLAAVSRPQPAGWVVDIDPGEPLSAIFPALALVPTGIVVVHRYGRVLGVVTADAVNEAAAGRGPRK